MAWLNNDGLYIKYGTDKAEAGKAGQPLNFGGRHTIELDLDLSEVSSNPTIVSDVVFFPKGAILEEVEVINSVASTGSTGNATLNIGLIKTDRTTALEIDGILKAADIDDFDAAGEKKVYTVGVSGIGDVVGVATSEPAYITADWDTADPVSGRVQVRIKYRSELNLSPQS